MAENVQDKSVCLACIKMKKKKLERARKEGKVLPQNMEENVQDQEKMDQIADAAPERMDQSISEDYICLICSEDRAVYTLKCCNMRNDMKFCIICITRFSTEGIVKDIVGNKMVSDGIYCPFCRKICPVILCPRLVIHCSDDCADLKMVKVAGSLMKEHYVEEVNRLMDEHEEERNQLLTEIARLQDRDERRIGLIRRRVLAPLVRIMDNAVDNRQVRPDRYFN